MSLLRPIIESEPYSKILFAKERTHHEATSHEMAIAIGAELKEHTTKRYGDGSET
jgi:hypothetical protein